MTAIAIRPPKGIKLPGIEAILALIAALLAMFATIYSNNFDADVQQGEVFYIGSFTGSTPADSPSCGTSISAPCSTLSYWTGSRRSSELSSCTPASPCIVRIAPGTYTGSTNHCILAQNDVTYEGRAADDTDLNDYTSVVIDAPGSGSPCNNSGVIDDSDGDYTNFTVRDLKIQDAQNIGILLRASSGVSVTNLIIDRVWVTGTINNLGIHIEQMFDQNDDCDVTGRRLDGALIVDTLLTENHGVQGGIAVGCATDVNLLRVEAYDNRGVGLSLADCVSSPSQSGCNDHDGIVFAGVVGGSIVDSIAGYNGEDNYDIGGHYKKTRDIILDGNKGYEAGSRNFKLSGGSTAITVRNSIFLDSMVEFASCTEDSKLLNNTILADDDPAFQMWAWCQNCEINNNILKTNTGSNVVFVSTAWTNATNTWDSNVIYHDFGTYAIREYSGIGGCNVTCGPSCPSTWPPAQSNDTLTTSEVATFRSESNSGDWFGSGSGANDAWGTAPTFTSTIVETDSDYAYITSSDSVAKDAGETLSGFSDDRDGVSRPQGSSWDIGANEVVL